MKTQKQKGGDGMYLKRLDMYGFKSFMDKLSVSFDYAITAIVGPNGSGKSNITDAIRWVLGEQSVKSLRGSKMEDVIFAGTAKHKPVSFAEVSLTLDNSSGLFSSPYSEITVTRRVYRSGEGEYFINKAPCRLRDIHELFMDTGLGRDGYSIISQGQIDSVLSQKSEDRRQIFEEAAGISRYKYKKLEAVRKLTGTEENLLRVRDIKDELSARLGPLETQAKKARTYLDLYEKLKVLEINLSMLDIEKLQKTKEETSVLFEALEKELHDAEADLSALQKEEEALFGEMKDRDAEMESVRSLLHATDLSVKGLEGDNALLQQRIETEEKTAAALSEEIHFFEAEGARLAEETEKADATISACRQALIDAEKAVEGGRELLEASAEAIRMQTGVQEELTAAAAQLRTQAEETEKYIASFSDADLVARISKLEADIAETKKRLSENASDKAAKEAEKEKILAETEKIASEFRTLAARLPEEKARLADEENTYNETMRRYNQSLSRKNALRDMEQNMEGYAKGVRAVIGARLSADIHGVLSQLIHVDTAHVTAIETALGSALQNIVVGREEDAKVAIEFLKKTREGRATFLPISAIRGHRLDVENQVKALPGYIGLGCDLVESDEAYREILLQLLGTTVIMDTMDHAISAARKFSHRFKIVTKDGEVLMRGGSMSGGSRGPQSHLLGRGEEIAALEKECEALSTALRKTEDSIDDLTDSVSEITETLTALRTSHGEKKAASMQLEGEIALCLSRNADEEKYLTRLTEDIESTRAQIENAEHERERLRAAHAELEKRCEEAMMRAEEARHLLRDYMEEQSRRRDALADLQIKVNSCEKDVETAENAKAQTLLAIQKVQADIRERTSRLAAANTTASDLRLRHQNRMIDIEEARKNAETLSENLTKMVADKETAESRSQKMRGALQSQTEKLYALKNEKTRLEAKLEKAQNDLDDTVTHLWDAYELTYSAAEGYRKDIGPVGPAKSEAAELRRAIRNLGHVNVDAVTEYAEVNERHTFLAAQLADLEKAKAELEKIIEDMTKVMTETFAKRFEEIAEHFKDTFRALFGGGTGKLSLTDPQNILESGIDIDVQPPGKKLQNLSLLSGGEKALTAIAILFSVLRVRPAPFCILDEIESALDDHNIDRFAAYLRDYADTQFIIVTHRRGTMEAADVLYGVTMQEKGISKLLTMQLSDIKNAQGDSES